MKLNKAISRVELAGREMGSGPAILLTREAFDRVDTLKSYGYTNPEAIALGIVIGLVMAENHEALSDLEKINSEWLDNRLS